ncbi:orotate phosphoribosyltransferase [Polaribacter sp. Hel1_85]|uniref:orotate phosphoribosyltransferase n=1 Tax=Polaribacter sp. Hel1_85 TaxID=1250005 RepID=UPI00052C9967|nr:orotate phosphoribosyltransferase [Polaribacter sp. Hel1_85]KGL64177.1 orotate phosphoribosyltransferase [Polaribacter sp. Hel1_85]
MNINGNTVVVEKSAEEVFTFFTDLKNFKEIMPENIKKFEVDGESFIFGLPGMPEIRLVLKEKTEFSNITLGAASSKLPFTLAADINEISENKTEVKLDFAGDFNPMMAMMIKKPLTKFVDTLTENIGKL